MQGHRSGASIGPRTGRAVRPARADRSRPMRWTRRFTPRAGEAAGARTALVHDYLLVMRGAERTFAAMAEAWPEATIHTLLHDPRATASGFAGRDVRTSALQRLGVRQSSFRRLLP